MWFEINTSNEFTKNPEGSIIIDGKLSEAEKIELRDAYECDCWEIRDETDWRLSELLHRDVIPHLETSWLDSDTQSKILELWEKHPFNPIDLWISIPQELEETLSNWDLDLSMERAVWDIEAYITRELVLPADSDISSGEHAQILKNIWSILQGKVDWIDNIVKESIENNDHLTLREARWIISSEISSELSSFKHNTLLNIKHLLEFSSLEEREKGPYRQMREHYTREADRASLEGEQRRLHIEGNIQASTMLLNLWYGSFKALATQEGFSQRDISREHDRLFHNSWTDIEELPQAHKDIDESLDISLLSEEDEAIERSAMLWFMWGIAWHIAIEWWPAVLASVVPWAGTAIWAIVWNLLWAGIDLADVFSDKEAILEILKTAWVVPQEYHMEKTLIDNILAGLWLIPWVTLVVKSAKLSSLMRTFKVSWDEVLQSMRNVLPILRWDNIESLEDVTSSAFRIENLERVSTWVASDEILEANWLLSESNRISKAGEELWITLTETQQELLMQAHNAPQWNNVQKWLILMREWGFSRNQAQILMDQGIAGIFDIFRKDIPLEYGDNLLAIDWNKIALWDIIKVETETWFKCELEAIEEYEWTMVFKLINSNWSVEVYEGFINWADKNKIIKVGNGLMIWTNNNIWKVKKISLIKPKEVIDIWQEVYVKRGNWTVERWWIVIWFDDRWRYIMDKGSERKVNSESSVFSIRQIEWNVELSNHAAEFERRKLQLLEWDLSLSKSHFTTLFKWDFWQKNTWNCYLVAALHSLKESPDFELIMRSSIKILNSDMVEVTVPLLSNWQWKKILINLKTDVQPQRIWQKTYQPIDWSLWFQILEAAYIKEKFWVLDRAKSEWWFWHEALWRMVWNNFDKTLIWKFSWSSLSEQWAWNNFIDFAQNYDPKRFIVTVWSISNWRWHDASYQIDGITIHYSHAYSVLNIDKFWQTVTLRNPWANNEPFMMTYDQFLRAFSDIDGVQINYNNLLSNI